MHRIGFSVDIHKLISSPKTRQKIGGLELILDYKIIAHSDGDIVYHAIAESIIGALGLGDLGDWFSDKKKDNQNLDSQQIINFALDKCKQENYKIANLDITIVCDAIYFGEIKKLIKDNLSKTLSTLVNLKCTRFESNNFEKIKCYSACLLIKSQNN